MKASLIGALARAAGLVACLLVTGQAPAEPVFMWDLPLSAEEGVFAYSRISPDGRYLTYAAERPGSMPPGASCSAMTRRSRCRFAA